MIEVILEAVEFVDLRGLLFVQVDEEELYERQYAADHSKPG